MFLVIGVCHSQKLIKTFDLLNNGDSAKAEKNFVKAIKKKKEPFAATFGYGLCLMKKQPKKSFICLKKTKAKFNNSDKYFHRYMKDNYGITPALTQQKMDEVASQQLRYTLANDSTETGFRAYIRTYKGCSKVFIQKALIYQEEAAYRAAKKDTSLKKANTFLKDYPFSYRSKYIIDYIDSVIYFKSLINGNYLTLTDFWYKNPKSKYRDQAKMLTELLNPETKHGKIIDLTEEYLNDWRNKAYYSGHWKIIVFFAKRLPHMMNDTLWRMYYASKYGELNFETRWYTPEKDSMYDYYIQRGAPSMLAFKKVIEKCSYLIQKKQYQDADDVITKYEPLFPNLPQEFYYMHQLLQLNEPEAKVKKLPSQINQNLKFNLYNRNPLISPDGKTLYFTHNEIKPIVWNRYTGETKIIKKTIKDTIVFDKDIYMSELKNGVWQKARPCPGLSKRDTTLIKVNPITNETTYTKLVFHEVVSGISADGTDMIIKENETIKLAGDNNFCTASVLRHSILGSKQWSNPKTMSHLNFYFHTNPKDMPDVENENFNGRFSPQGNVVFFCANRVGIPGYNEKFTDINDYLYHMELPGVPLKVCFLHPDIYYSVKQPDGLWSYPSSIGKIINTEYGEYSPYLAADNRTLYFISEGHYGVGGTDIYMTKRTNDTTWTDWGPPINLGRNINTAGNEYDFSITADGKTAYFSSEDPLTGKITICSVELPMKYRPDSVAIFSGKITDLQGNPIPTKIQVRDEKNQKIYAEYKNKITTGEFYFGLPQDKYYGFTFNSRGYFPISDTLDATGINRKTIYKNRDYKLASESDIFEKRLSIPLEGVIFFDQNIEPSSESIPVISKLKNYLSQHEYPKVEITVYASKKDLAENRAKYIAAQLIKFGIKKEKLLYSGKQGKDKTEFRITDENLPE